jgi:hypothetical protein
MQTTFLNVSSFGRAFLKKKISLCWWWYAYISAWQKASKWNHLAQHEMHSHRQNRLFRKHIYHYYNLKTNKLKISDYLGDWDTLIQPSNRHCTDDPCCLIVLVYEINIPSIKYKANSLQGQVIIILQQKWTVEVLTNISVSLTPNN